MEENLTIKQWVEDRIRNVPEAKRERAFINAAKCEAHDHAIRLNGIRR